VIQSLQRALGILEFVARNGTAVSAVDISRNIGLHASTTYHLLQTLTTLGYLTQDDADRKYRVGTKAFQIAASAWNETRLVTLAAPFLDEVAQQTGETSFLALFARGEIVPVAKVEGRGPIHVTERVGAPRPAYCTAIGKILLAFFSENQLKVFLAKNPLRPFTPNTIVSVGVLRRELKRVRDQGYAVDDEEFMAGVRCVAAPLRNFTGNVVASIGISGPAWQMTPDRVSDIADYLKPVAHRLSQQLGYCEHNDGIVGPSATASRAEKIPPHSPAIRGRRAGAAAKSFVAAHS
jgi:DNA-binding IclR family transcriptional regulator